MPPVQNFSQSLSMSLRILPVSIGCLFSISSNQIRETLPIESHRIGSDRIGSFITESTTHCVVLSYLLRTTFHFPGSTSRSNRDAVRLELEKPAAAYPCCASCLIKGLSTAIRSPTSSGVNTPSIPSWEMLSKGGS